MKPNDEAKYCPLKIQYLHLICDEDATCNKRACEWWTETNDDEGCAVRVNVGTNPQVIVNTRKKPPTGKR